MILELKTSSLLIIEFDSFIYLQLMIRVIKYLWKDNTLPLLKNLYLLIHANFEKKNVCMTHNFMLTLTL